MGVHFRIFLAIGAIVDENQINRQDIGLRIGRGQDRQASLRIRNDEMRIADGILWMVFGHFYEQTQTSKERLTHERSPAHAHAL